LPSPFDASNPVRTAGCRIGIGEIPEIGTVGPLRSDEPRTRTNLLPPNFAATKPLRASLERKENQTEEWAAVASAKAKISQQLPVYRDSTVSPSHFQLGLESDPSARRRGN
jgi:hypothetical protein